VSIVCSTQGVLKVGVEHVIPASIAFLHLSRGNKAQGTSQANAIVEVVVVVVDVVEVVVVIVVKVLVVYVLVVDVIVDVLVVLVVVVVLLVEVLDVLVVVVEEVVVTGIVELGSIISSKHSQKAVSFVKFHEAIISSTANTVVNVHDDESVLFVHSNVVQ